MSREVRADLLQDFLRNLEDIENKEKGFTETLTQTLLSSDQMRKELLTHVAYIEGRLHRLIEITKTIMRIERRNIGILEELENSLDRISGELQASCAFKGPSDLQDYYFVKFMTVRNRIIDKVGFQLAYGRLFSDRLNPLLNLLAVASFLDLDLNWVLSAVALQLHEVAIRRISGKMGIDLDRKTIENILEKEIKLEHIKFMPFNQQYKAFAKVIKTKKGTRMPMLVQDMRKTRTNVLHLGYKPTIEETNSIITFTYGLLDRLRTISNATSR